MASAADSIEGVTAPRHQFTLNQLGWDVTLTTTFTCDLGQMYSLDAFLDQNPQHTVAYGGYYSGGACTGETQTHSVDVRSWPRPFSAGTAEVTVNITSYGYNAELGYHADPCGSASTTRTVRVEQGK